MLYKYYKVQMDFETTTRKCNYRFGVSFKDATYLLPLLQTNLWGYKYRLVVRYVYLGMKNMILYHGIYIYIFICKYYVSNGWIFFYIRIFLRIKLILCWKDVQHFCWIGWLKAVVDYWKPTHPLHQSTCSLHQTEKLLVWATHQPWTFQS